MNTSYCFRFLYIFLIPMVLVAQVPNAGFELWTDGNPNDWLTNNLTGVVTVVTQSGTAHSGSSAVRGEVATFAQEPYPPILFSGLSGSGFSVDQRYGNLSGYYQFFPSGGDNLIVFVVMYKEFTPLGFGEISLDAAASYTQFNVPIDYFSGETPTSCLIEIVIDDSITATPDVGTYFLVDDLSLSGTTAIVDNWQNSLPETFFLGQNSPNPFNPVTTIEYGLRASGKVKLEVFSQTGQHITTLYNGTQSAGRHVIRWEPVDLASGVYIYRLEADNQVIARKMMFVK